MGVTRFIYISNKIYHIFKNRGVAQILKNICRILYACDVSYKIKIGRNLRMPHQGLGTVIGPDVVLGDDVTIYHNVTLESRDNGMLYAAPVIGNHVMIGAGAVILGGYESVQM